MTEEKITREPHPNWYHDIPEMKLLILGTFPPHESKRKYPFYYPNPSNRFWTTMAHLAGVKLNFFAGDEAVRERQIIMEKLQIGIQNMGLVIHRNGTSSADRDIKIVEYQKNLKDILLNYPKLKSVLLTGFTDEHSTFYTFVRYLDQLKITHTAPKIPKAGALFHVECGRTLHCWIGNSTSRAARGIKPETLIHQFETALKDAHRN